MKVHFIALAILCLAVKFSYAQDYKDCTNPFSICELKTYHFDNLAGKGAIEDVQDSKKCDQFIEESNSLWLEFKVASDGTLMFTISPEDAADDVDFILYRKYDNCKSLEEVRCMQSGLSYGNGQRNAASCKGETGLNDLSVDEFELSGCKYNDDNFLKFLSAKSEESYILYINNYDSPKGLSISFDGTCSLGILESCEDVSNDFSLEILGLFPNPVTDNLSIHYFNPTQGSCKIELLTIDGKVIKSFREEASVGKNPFNIDVRDLAKSTYLIRVSQGGRSSVKQFIKQ